MKKYIWLIGENLGKTTNNNSYYFWEHVVLVKDEIDKYLVLTKSEKNRKFVNGLDVEKQKRIIWKNSIKHYILWEKSDMWFVTLSYKDVAPTSFLGKETNFRINKPVVYLQHGTLGMKKVGYKGNGYNNNMYKFVYYNRSIAEQMIEKNDMREYQLYYGEAHPRYKEMFRLAEIHKPKEGKTILWFLTWREYLAKGTNKLQFLYGIKKIINSPELKQYLEETGSNLRICTHMFFGEDIANEVADLSVARNVEIVLQNEVDVMKELVEADVLITDYSSVCFDFTALKKPTILFQPDIDEYLGSREIYCEVSELNQYNVKSNSELIRKLVEEDYEITEFCHKRLIDMEPEKIIKGEHIDKIYNDFKKQQLNKITFIGYNFFGIGGTVNATLALAEKLLEKNYLVELVSLKRIPQKSIFPYGLNVVSLSWHGTKSRRQRIMQKIIRNRKHLDILKKDPSVELILPIAGIRLKKLMANIRTNTLISTRESLHKIVSKVESPYVKNKVHFFHTPRKIMEEMFLGVKGDIAKLDIEKSIFVTDNAKEESINYYGDTCLGEKVTIGNTIQMAKMCTRKEVEDKLSIRSEVELDSDYTFKCVYLVRVSKERSEDLQNLLDFGKYLKENAIKNIIIDVYGGGDSIEWFLDMVYNDAMEDIIKYKGEATDVKECLGKYDCMTDFTYNHTFGMIYIESVLNGLPIFCTKNTGSLEVLEGIENAYYDSYKQLSDKILKVYDVPKENILNSYDIINRRYTEEVVTKFIDGVGL